MKANRVLASALPVLLVTACGGPPPRPAPAPVPIRVARPAPVIVAPPPDWRDAPQTPGTWRWRMEGERSVASYGPYGAEPVASLTCDPSTHTTILWRSWSVTGQTPLAVTTTGIRRLLTASPDAHSNAAASIAANDPLLDAMAFSRGRFMLEMPGAPTLYLPAWPELSRVIEDCR